MKSSSLLSVRVFAAAAISMLLAAPTGRAATELGDNDFQISALSRGAQLAAVAFNPVRDEFFVVWEGGTNNADDIFGQRLDAEGNEVGEDDLQISFVDGEGESPAIAYNPTRDEYLVVWEGQVQGEVEIYGQRLDGLGAPVGVEGFRISDMGIDGATNTDARAPSVAFNPADGGYLVVWEGRDDTPPMVDLEREIFGQLLDGQGHEVGPNDFRISFMGPDGTNDFEARSTDVVANPSAPGYLVVWTGSDDRPPLVSGENEIFGQLIDLTGSLAGTTGIRISDMGADGNEFRDAFDPAVAFDPATARYLVVWSGDDGTPPLEDNENEIFGQLLGQAGDEVGPNDFRISDAGADGINDIDAGRAEVAHDPATGLFVVLWSADDRPRTVVAEKEIFGQLVDVTGAEVGENDFRLSDMGPDGDPDFDANLPALAVGADGLYLAVWDGDEEGVSQVQVFGQRFESVRDLAVTVEGLTIRSAACRNQDTGQQVFEPTVDGTVWNCAEAGLTYETGQRTAILVRTRASFVEPAAAGSVSGGALAGGTCTNVTTGQSVVLGSGGGAWDCELSGLIVGPGELVEVLLRVGV